MKPEPGSHSYRIHFPGGELIYHPLEGRINDLTRGRTVDLPNRRDFSLLNRMQVGRTVGSSDFKPICLTLYSSNQCNLACTYCYIPNKENQPTEFLDPAFIESGARMVAENCKERNKPFILGFHGGNEPLLQPERIKESLDICQSVARSFGVDILPFCTSNGVVPESTARWAAGAFHGLTLSWDGPSIIHNTYRKDRAGQDTDYQVKRSAAIFSDPKEGLPLFLVRCTITSASVNHMEELTPYFHLQGISAIEYHPVFQNRLHPIEEGIIPDPHTFIFNFLKARDYGRKKGIQLMFSGSRIMDHHGRYCMVMQDNLTITPDGFLTNCFQRTENHHPDHDRFMFGSYDPERNTLFCDQEKLSDIILKSRTELYACLDCFNQFHCSSACPDLCPFEESFQPSEEPDCLKEKWLGLAGILELAGYFITFSDKAECIDFFERSSYQRI